MEVEKTNRIGLVKDWFLSRNVVVTICLLVILSSAFTIYRRTYIQWVIPSQSLVDNISYIQAILDCVPFFCLPLIILAFVFRKSAFISKINSFISLKWIIPFCYGVIVLCIILTFTNAPFVFGSWPSLATVFAFFMLFVSFTYGRLPNIMMLFCFIGLLGTWTGIWELPYQIALKLNYDAPQIGLHEAYRFIQWEFIVELPVAGCGLCILAFMQVKYHILKFSKWFWVYFLMSVLFIWYWMYDGFWVDTHYDWTLKQWVQTDGFNKLHLFLSKASKVWYLLALISLIWRKPVAES